LQANLESCTGLLSALEALTSRLFSHGELGYQGAFMDFKSGRMAPLRMLKIPL
jgi:hypothetical protein